MSRERVRIQDFWQKICSGSGSGYVNSNISKVSAFYLATIILSGHYFQNLEDMISNSSDQKMPSIY